MATLKGDRVVVLRQRNANVPRQDKLIHSGRRAVAETSPRPFSLFTRSLTERENSRVWTASRVNGRKVWTGP